MEKQIEIEFKTLLDLNEYTYLDKYIFEGIKPIYQVNYYFDTKNKDLFMKKRMARIRKINEEYLFTLKTPLELGVQENEIILDKLDIMNVRLNELFQDINIKQEELKQITCSKTSRKEIIDKYGTWCLDYNNFSSSFDYELEYELHPQSDYDAAYKHYLKFLKQNNITFKQAKPKYIRALESQID